MWPGLLSIGLLTSLNLKYVDVASEVLEGLLSICPLLEQLFVKWSIGLVKFKVAGPTPFRLKELEIRACRFLQELEIDSPNLVCFSYTGPDITLRMQNVPRLVTVCFDFWPYESTLFALGKHQNGYLSQLQTLRLSLEQVSMFKALQLLQFS